jgi:hypothetical protein
MIMFAALFRNPDSAVQYIRAVRWMYIYLNCAITWESDKLKQCLKGVRKAALVHGVKLRLAIRWDLLKCLVELAWRRHDFAYALAYVLAAAFLLRCKNELIPLSFEQIDFNLEAAPPTVSLKLPSRKNLPQGTVLKRRCICRSHPVLCPVHIFDRFVQATKRERRGRVLPFSYQSFLNVMRAHLRVLDVEHAERYGTKAFRRGTAREMVASGSSLAEVLAAGQWRSAAFLLYIEKADVEEEAVFAALDALSDEE